MSSAKSSEIIKSTTADACINTEVNSVNLSQKDSKLRDCIVRGLNFRLQSLLDIERRETARFKSMMLGQENSIKIMINAISKAFKKFKQSIDFCLTNSDEKYNSELDMVNSRLQQFVKIIYKDFYDCCQTDMSEGNLSSCLKDILDIFSSTLPQLLKNIDKHIIEDLFSIEKESCKSKDVQKSHDLKTQKSNLAKIVTKDHDLNLSESESEDKDIEMNELVRLKCKVRKLTKEVKYLNNEVKVLTINKRKYYLPPLDDSNTTPSSQENTEVALQLDTVNCPTSVTMQNKVRDFDLEKCNDMSLIKKVNLDLVDLLVNMKVECSGFIPVIECKKFKKLVKQGNQLLCDFFSLKKKCSTLHEEHNKEIAKFREREEEHERRREKKDRDKEAELSQFSSIYQENLIYKAQIEDLMKFKDEDIKKCIQVVDLEKEYKECKKLFDLEKEHLNLIISNQNEKISKMDQYICEVNDSNEKLINRISYLRSFVPDEEFRTPIIECNPEYMKVEAKYIEQIRDIDYLKTSNSNLQAKLTESYIQIDEIFTKTESLKENYLTCKQVIHSQNESINNLCELKSSSKIKIDNLESKCGLMRTNIESLTEKIVKLEEVCKLQKDHISELKNLIEKAKVNEGYKNNKIRETEEIVSKLSEELINCK